MVDGMDVREYKITDLRDKIGIVPQKAVLFAGTVRSNLAWGKEDATEEEMQQALSVAQAAEVVDKKDGKLDAEVEQGGKNFSGGQKQRLTIARALAHLHWIMLPMLNCVRQFIICQTVRPYLSYHSVPHPLCMPIRLSY